MVDGRLSDAQAVVLAAAGPEAVPLALMGVLPAKVSMQRYRFPDSSGTIDLPWNAAANDPDRYDQVPLRYQR